MEERYNYSINPRKRIKSEFVIFRNVRTPKTLALTKREVVDALKYCLVYRRFDAQTIKKVNLMNLDRMHQEAYDPTLEQEIKPISFEEDAMVEDKEIPVDEEKETISTEPVDKTEEEVKEVIPEDTEKTTEPVVEDTEEIIPPAVEEEPIEVGETVEESIPDVIEPTVEIEENKEYTQNNKKYNNNKKHH